MLTGSVPGGGTSKVSVLTGMVSKRGRDVTGGRSMQTSTCLDLKSGHAGKQRCHGK